MGASPFVISSRAFPGPHSESDGGSRPLFSQSVSKQRAYEKAGERKGMKVLKAIGAGLAWFMKWVWNSAMEERRNKG